MLMLLPRTALARLQSVTVPAVAWLVVALVGSLVGAHWFWRFSAPGAAAGVYATSSDPGNAANEISSRHLFGVPVVEPTEEIAAVTLGAEIKLLGVMTGAPNSPGFAVILEEGQPSSRPVIEGEELRPGIKLVKVLAQGIQLDVGGRQQFIPLIDPNGGSLPQVPVMNNSTQQPAGTTPRATIMGKGGVARDIAPPPPENPLID